MYVRLLHCKTPPHPKPPFVLYSWKEVSLGEQGVVCSSLRVECLWKLLGFLLHVCLSVLPHLFIQPFGLTDICFVWIMIQCLLGFVGLMDVCFVWIMIQCSLGFFGLVLVVGNSQVAPASLSTILCV